MDGTGFELGSMVYDGDSSGYCGITDFTRFPPDMILLGALTVLLMFNILTPDQALIGFSNEGMLPWSPVYSGSVLRKPRSRHTCTECWASPNQYKTLNYG